jgi:YggT family protein
MSADGNAAETGLLTVLKGVTWVVYIFVSAAEIFLAFMFGLQLLGANAKQPFVEFIYRWGNLFLRPFKGIFPPTLLGNGGFINWNAVVAICAYAVIAWLIGMVLNSISRRLSIDRAARYATPKSPEE